METETMEVKVLNPRLDVKSFGTTCLRGYLKATYQELITAFGEPDRICDEYKVDVMWHIIVNGHPITIYNWKNGKHYLGDDGEDVENMTEWHIGGRKDGDGMIRKFFGTSFLSLQAALNYV